MPDRQAIKHSLGTEGANADYRQGDDKDWRVPQRNDSKARYWAEPINKAADTTTGKGGSKRD